MKLVAVVVICFTLDCMFVYRWFTAKSTAIYSSSRRDRRTLRNIARKRFVWNELEQNCLNTFAKCYCVKATIHLILFISHFVCFCVFRICYAFLVSLKQCYSVMLNTNWSKHAKSTTFKSYFERIFWFVFVLFASLKSLAFRITRKLVISTFARKLNVSNCGWMLWERDDMFFALSRSNPIFILFSSCFVYLDCLSKCIIMDSMVFV